MGDVSSDANAVFDPLLGILALFSSPRDTAVSISYISGGAIEAGALATRQIDGFRSTRARLRYQIPRSNLRFSSCSFLSNRGGTFLSFLVIPF